MANISKESLINKNKKNISSFYSITEKQEESSNSSINDSKLNKQLVTDNSSNIVFLKIDNIANKEIYNNGIKHINMNNFFKQKSSKSFNNIIKEKKEEKINEEEKYKIFLRKESDKRNKNTKKRTSITSIKQNIYDLTIKNEKNNEIFSIKRNSSSKNFNLPFQIFKKMSNNKEKINMNLSTFNNYLNNNKILSLFNSPIPKKKILRKKSFNLSSSVGSFIRLYSNKKLKNDTIVLNKKIKINDGYDKIIQISLFDKLKNSPMFEKSEKIIYREKILFTLLGFFSLMSIVFQILDAFLYNEKSNEYIENNKDIFDLKNISSYYFIQKRKISFEENLMRIINLIFSFLCIIVALNIIITKNKYVKQANKNNKNFYNYYNNNYLDNYRKRKMKKNIKDNEHISIVPNNDDMIPKKKLPKIEIIKTIITCFINFIVFPPSFNKIYIKKNKDIISVYSLNNIFLIGAIFKIINIYRAIIHLSSLNNLIYKTICNSKMVKMDFSFMARYMLNRYPMAFILINFFLIGAIFCILIFSIEYFSIDIRNGHWNNKGDNNLKNIYNTSYLFLFYIIKNIYGDIQPKSFLGLFVMISVGTIGLFITSYFIYYTSELIKFNNEEQKAYSKLKKILNPINKEHKASNLIKIFITMKKIIEDSKNLVNNNITKKKDKLKEIHKKSQKTNYLFNIFRNKKYIDNNLKIITNINEFNANKNFINYLIKKFIFKIKLISECNNLKNNLLIARNFSHSFTDLLKTLGHKINENLNQLNNKLQILIKKEKKYKDFIKYQKIILKRTKKIIGYQDFALTYLINKHNNNYEEYLNNKKYKRKEKSKRTGTDLIGSSKNLGLKYKNNIDNNNYDYFKNTKIIGLNRIKSSILGSDTSLNFRRILKYKPNYINKLKKQKSKSLNNIYFNNNNIIKKSLIFGLIDIKKNNKRKSSYNFKKNEIFDKIKIDIE